MTDYGSIPTPETCYADFCLIPVSEHPTALPKHRLDLQLQVGTGTASVASEVAEVQRVLKASGLKYTMHSAGTTVGKVPPPPTFFFPPRVGVSLSY